MLPLLVATGGAIAVGDQVQLVRVRACAESAAAAVFAEYEHGRPRSPRLTTACSFGATAPQLMLER